MPIITTINDRPWSRYRIEGIFCLILITLASFFYLADLGKLPLDDYDEAGYAIVAREMIQNNDYLNLTYLGKPWFEKPPLYFWLMALSGKIFGLNEFAMRFPSAIFGIVVVILTYLITKELTRSPIAAFLSGLILITMPFFLAAARHSRMDVPVTATIMAAAYFYLKGGSASSPQVVRPSSPQGRRQPVFWAGIGPSIAIGFLLKSAISFLAIPIILLWSFIFKDWRWLKNKYFWLGMAGAILIILPWHIYQISVFGETFLQDYFGYHLFQRATQNILSNQITVGYFLWVLWTHSQPWSGLIIMAAIFMALILTKKNWRQKIAQIFPALGAAGGAALLIFLAFVSVKTRLMPYFTTLYPFAAAFLAASQLAVKNIFPKLKNGFGRLTINWVIYGLIAALLIWGLLTIYSEIFVRAKIYALDISKDEKAVGVHLADHRNQEPVYIFNWRHIQTIRYYSEIDPEIIQSGEESLSAQPPLWIILPTALLKENPWLENSPKPFSGPFLTLVHFQP